MDCLEIQVLQMKEQVVVAKEAGGWELEPLAMKGTPEIVEATKRTPRSRPPDTLHPLPRFASLPPRQLAVKRPIGVTPVLLRRPLLPLAQNFQLPRLQIGMQRIQLRSLLSQ